MVKAELMSYQRFGFDRLGIGPNTRGISDALADQVPDKKQGSLVLDDYSKLEYLEPVNARNDLVIQRFLQAAEMLQESAGEIVPVEISIGGPLTIASFCERLSCFYAIVEEMAIKYRNYFALLWIPKRAVLMHLHNMA